MPYHTFPIGGRGLRYYKSQGVWASSSYISYLLEHRCNFDRIHFCYTDNRSSSLRVYERERFCAGKPIKTGIRFSQLGSLRHLFVLTSIRVFIHYIRTLSSITMPTCDALLRHFRKMLLRMHIRGCTLSSLIYSWYNLIIHSY